MSQTAYIHPRANRQVQLGLVTVSYCLERAHRRSIGFVVGAEGLVVRIPLRAAVREVEAALQEKADWIVRKLQETQLRFARQQALRLDWRDGARLPYLGQQIGMKLQPVAGARRPPAVLLCQDAADAPVLHIPVPLLAEEQHIKSSVQLWLMQQAQQHFRQRLDHFAPMLQVCWTRLALSQAATRWGSAKSDGSIRLNWRLMHLQPAVLDYVVVHELSHLREMNHSPRFWNTVRSVLPDYSHLRKQLKEAPAPGW